MLSRIKDLAEKLAPRLIEIRRHLHSHPELSGQEQQTAAYVAGVLSSCDCIRTYAPNLNVEYVGMYPTHPWSVEWSI